MKVKEAVKFSGRSEYWLRTRECAWCGQTCLKSLTDGCGAIWTKCKPLERKYIDSKKLNVT